MAPVLFWLFAGAVGGTIYLWRRSPRGPTPLTSPDGPPQDRGEAVRRVLKHLQRKKVGELVDGSAAVVVGTVREVTGVPHLTSPVTGTRCLGYHVDVRRRELDDHWRFPQLYETARCIDIDVTDDTGTIRVVARGLELAITDGQAFSYDRVPPPLQSVIAPRHHAHGVTVEEGVLHDGATILVCGLVSRQSSATDYRDGAQHLVMSASATFPLVASTDRDLLAPGDRPIAPEELHRR